MYEFKVFKNVFEDSVALLTTPTDSPDPFEPRSPRIQLVDVFARTGYYLEEVKWVSIHVELGDDDTDYDVVMIYTDSKLLADKLFSYLCKVHTRLGQSIDIDADISGRTYHITYKPDHVLVLIQPNVM